MDFKNFSLDELRDIILKACKEIQDREREPKKELGDKIYRLITDYLGSVEGGIPIVIDEDTHYYLWSVNEDTDGTLTFRAGI